jgi:hypothetical protein
MDHFEKTFKIVAKYVETKLEFTYCMVKSTIPKIVRDQNATKSFIYLSKDFLEKKNLCVIIPDRGDNPPGIFDKSALFYESLKKATVFPYVVSAMKGNYAVMLMNPNDLKDGKSGKVMTEFSDHYGHCEYFWNEFITGKRFESVIIIAHQLASISVIKLVNKFSKLFI